MTLLELLDIQNSSNGKRMFLIKIGAFYRAYDNAAFAIHNLMGYKIVRKRGKDGKPLFYVGFPATQLDKVVDEINAHGGRMGQVEEGIIGFKDISYVVEEGAKIIDADSFRRHKHVDGNVSALVKTLSSLLLELTKNTNINIDIHITVGDNASKKK